MFETLALRLCLFRFWLAGMAFLLPVRTVHAHIGLMDPAPRTNMENFQKVYPCGNLPRSETPTVYYSDDESLEVRWIETIQHPGWYRISLITDSDQAFEDHIMVDDFADVAEGGYLYEVSIDLPASGCTECTLQLVQVMTDKVPVDDTYSGFQEYFACADLEVRNGASPASNPEPGPGAEPNPDPGSEGTPSPNDPSIAAQSTGCQAAFVGAEPAALGIFGAWFFGWRRRVVSFRL